MTEVKEYYIRLRYDESITLAQHIENVSVAHNTLVRMPQCADDEELKDNIQQLVVAYDRLLIKVALEHKDEVMKNESL